MTERRRTARHVNGREQPLLIDPGCAFCESKVRHIAHGDVEHFRPKAGYEQGHRFNRNGYFWEAYRWENLYYSCQTCNQVYKGNRPRGMITLIESGLCGTPP